MYAADYSFRKENQNQTKFVADLYKNWKSEGSYTLTFCNIYRMLFYPSGFYKLVQAKQKTPTNACPFKSRNIRPGFFLQAWSAPSPRYSQICTSQVENNPSNWIYKTDCYVQLTLRSLHRQSQYSVAQKTFICQLSFLLKCNKLLLIFYCFFVHTSQK